MMLQTMHAGDYVKSVKHYICSSYHHAKESKQLEGEDQPVPTAPHQDTTAEIEH
jgi:hypothetical protein